MKHGPIILVDDDIEDLELMAEMAVELRLPNEILTFSDPIDALAFLKKTLISPALIICDINMPKLDGFQFRAEIIKIESPIKDVPFLFLTTSDLDTDRFLAGTLNIHAYYTKKPTFSGMKETLLSIMSSLNIIPGT